MEEILQVLEEYKTKVDEEYTRIEFEYGLDEARFMGGVGFGVEECIKVIKSRL